MLCKSSERTSENKSIIITVVNGLKKNKIEKPKYRIHT